MSSKILILLCLLRLSAHAQDTLCMRAGGCMAVKILEIGVKDVSFKRSDNPDGPLFVYSKNDIKRIRYANGYVDTFAVVKEQPKVSIQRPSYAASPDFNMVQSTSRAGVFVYQGGLISDNKLIQLASARNEKWKDRQIDAEIEQTKSARTLQYSIGYGGLGVGLASMLVIGNLGNNYSNNSEAQAGVSVAGIGLFIASQVVSYHFKIVRGRHGRRLADLYNANNH